MIVVQNWRKLLCNGILRDSINYTEDHDNSQLRTNGTLSAGWETLSTRIPGLSLP
jgi:hypothetical protein